MKTPWPEKAKDHPDARFTTVSPHQVDGYVELNLSFEEYELAARCVNMVARAVPVQTCGEFGEQINYQTPIEFCNALIIHNEETKI